MADLVKIRGSVFIARTHWLPPVQDAATGNIFEFEADIRDFNPAAVNTGRSRVEQEVVVDFSKRRLISFANTGMTMLRITAPDGTVEYKRGKAPTEGITVGEEAWEDDAVSFVMRASASNPLRAEAPTVDYRLQVKVTADGTVHVQGDHDGFPCYEFYKQVDFGPFETLYTHDFYLTGDTPAAMAGDMEYHFDIKL